jgi:hypothetical protein
MDREVYVNFEHRRGKRFLGRYHRRTACGYAEVVISPSRAEAGNGGRRSATRMNWVPLMGDRGATGQV